jgi:formylglycine-generating enzyme required for sulfatase activity
VKSCVLTNGLWNFQDTNASVAGQRFYRSVAQGGERPATPEGMVWLPPGTFTMGSPLDDPDYIGNEGPQTEVRLTQGFFLGRREVSQGEYQSLMGGNPSWFFGDTNLPVESVTWRESTNYCAKLTQREQTAGRIPATWHYRLPTEAEWEYACRAGSTTRYFYGADPGYDRLDNYAWIFRNSGAQTHRIGLKLPNAWGLYDMNGNVSEWCQDWLGFYRGGFATDPRDSETDSYRAVRGGSLSNSIHGGQFIDALLRQAKL